MKCPQCGHQNAKHYKFCLECGAEIPSVSVESTQRTPVKRVGFSDAFEAQPEHNPSPETLIRQVEDISSGIGMGNPLTTPPPLGLKSESERAILNKFSTPASAKEKFSQDKASILDSALNLSSASNAMPSLDSIIATNAEEADTPPPISDSLNTDQPSSESSSLSPKGSLLGSSLSSEESSSPDLDFHTNLNKGRDSLADFERELFGGELAEASARIKESDQAGSDDVAMAALDQLSDSSKASHEPVVDDAPLPLTCSNCSAVIPTDFLFCGKCGTKVEASSSEPLEVALEVTPKPMIAEASEKPILEEQVHLGSSTADLEQAPPTLVKLIHIHLDGSEGEALNITEPTAILGRDHSWEIFESDDYLSPQHAKIELNEHGEVHLTDLGGINGIFIRLTKPVTLASGDFFRAGQQLFAYEGLKGEGAVNDPQGTKRLGSPVYETWGRLSHIVGQGEIGRSWLLHGELVTLGRVKGDIVFDQDRFMSSRHCSLTLSQGELILTDQGSTNGTFVRIREAVTVQDGDLILLGQKIFKVKTV